MTKKPTNTKKNKLNVSFDFSTTSFDGGFDNITNTPKPEAEPPIPTHTKVANTEEVVPKPEKLSQTLKLDNLAEVKLTLTKLVEKNTNIEDLFNTIIKTGFSNQVQKDILDILLYQYIKGTTFEENSNIMLNLFGSETFTPQETYTTLMGYLESYTFSIQDTPKEGKVSFDFLCKVFEMSIPTEDVEDGDIKKNTGSVYTPKDIAYFMTLDVISYYLLGQKDFEELDKNTLDTVLEGLFLGTQNNTTPEELLNGIEMYLKTSTILEPSIGAGAFAHSYLVTVTQIRRSIATLLGKATEEEYQLHNIKSHVLTTNLYGVDINKEALEMARKRLWMSFLSSVPEGLGYTIELPNTELNIVVGNSVIGGNLSILKDEETYDNIKQDWVITKKASGKPTLVYLLPSDLTYSERTFKYLLESRSAFLVANVYDKETLLTNTSLEYKRLLQEFARVNMNKHTGENPFLEDLSSIKTLKQLEDLFKTAFSYHLMFPHLVEFKDGDIKEGLFDMVLGNPPYVRGNLLGDLKDCLSKFKTNHGSADLLVYFYEQGNKLLKENGVLSYITSNKWLTSKYGEPLRAYLLGDKFDATKPGVVLLALIDFKGNRVFKGVGVDTEITVFRKSIPTSETKLVYCSGERYEVQD